MSAPAGAGADQDTRPRWAQDLPQYVEWAAVLLAPLTAVTALLLYVGWVRTRAYFGYFGVSLGLLDFGPQDYVLRSAEVGLGAVILLAFAGVVLLALDRLVTAVLARWASAGITAWLRPALAATGAVLVVVGLGGATSEAVSAIVAPVVGAGLVAVGTVLVLRFGPPRAGRSRVVTWAGGSVVLALAGFWAANAYASTLGAGAARDVDADSSHLPVVTVFSDEPVDLPGAFVRPERYLGPDEKWQYRYIGAALLTFANDRWFLLTGPATPEFRSPVVVLRDSDDIHVETAVPR